MTGSATGTSPSMNWHAIFQNKSQRVKGLSFHPTRPWVLASLHNGAIQLWDFNFGTLIHSFDEHDGPVRSVQFHPTQPLFVSGGDDYKIRVWNYKQKRCLFALTGHMDYIRSVQFHHEFPWIISASDDQTIRIWNWQSRSCISVVTGHSHYVMCAMFHPREELIVSASLDQTIRIWDYSALRKKNAASAGGSRVDERTNHPELFSPNDVFVRNVLEGHERGVNWISIHPTKPLIASGSDDRQVKLWSYTSSRAWEVESFRGHYNNISCVLFHPKSELLLSNSEDKSLRVWDMNKKTNIKTFRLEHERYWTLTVHPKFPFIYAAGHDGGFVVFKMEKERPLFSVSEGIVHYFAGNILKGFDLNTASEMPSKSIAELSSSLSDIHVNLAEKALLIAQGGENPRYDLVSLTDPSKNFHRSFGTSPIFLGKNRVASIDIGAQTINIRTLKNDSSKEIPIEGKFCYIANAGGGNLLIIRDASVDFLDVQQSRITASLKNCVCKRVFWTADHSFVALMGKTGFIIANKKLQRKAVVKETLKIRSGYWHPSGVFFYSTNAQVKYALLNGETGVISSLERPIWIVSLLNNTLVFLDSESKLGTMKIDPTEYEFKLALEKRNYSLVFDMIRSNSLLGQAIISYLRSKGYPEVALQFVKDVSTRFDLALECGNMDIAVECAKQIDKEPTWMKLAHEAMLIGNHQIVEVAYQRTRRYDKLMMLYVVTGQKDKLKILADYLEGNQQYGAQYQAALLLGDPSMQIKLLTANLQLPLAYLVAKSNGLEEEAEAFCQAAGKEPEDICHIPLGKLSIPNAVSVTTANWPLSGKIETMFDRVQKQEQNEGYYSAGEEEVKQHHQYENPIEDASEPAIDAFAVDSMKDALEGVSDWSNAAAGWGMDDEAVLDTTDIPNEFVDSEVQSFPSASRDPRLNSNSLLASQQIAIGAIENAMQIFHKQVGIISFDPLKPFFMKIISSCRSYMKPFDLAPPISNLITTANGALKSPFSLAYCKKYLASALQLTTAGKFTEALDEFRHCLYSTLFICLPSNASEAHDEIVKIISTCSQYILAMRLELHRRQLPDLESDPNSIRLSLELSAYFTHCKLMPVHETLSLRSAMMIAYKAKNFKASFSFARRLLAMSPPEPLYSQVKKLIAVVEKTPTDCIPVDYDEMMPFVIDSLLFKPIYKGSSVTIECPFCSAVHVDTGNIKGKLCANCNVSAIGLACAGYRSSDQ